MSPVTSPRRAPTATVSNRAGGDPDVSIIVVSYNTAALTDRCLDSIPAALGDLTAEVIVVDNASVDDSVDRLRRRHPEVTVVANHDNIGFARAVNQAARRARAPWLLLLNPDTVAEAGAVDALVNFARRHPGHGIYGGRTLTPEGTVDPRSCWGSQTLWSLWCFATMLDVIGRHTRTFDPESLGRWPRDTVREVGMVTGCLLLASGDVWRELDGFDERFFMYGEDADLSLRARRAGHRPVVTPDATVVHLGGGSPIRATDKTVLLLTARATIIRNRWSPARSRIGITLLHVGVGVRALVARVAPVRRGREVWIGAWRRRRDWSGGYPATPAAASRVEAGTGSTREDAPASSR